jgi:hypothetical protein
LFNKTVPAFKMIGAKKYAGIINVANKIFKLNEKDFENKTGLFNKLDQEFYNTYDQENLFELKKKFIRSELNAFVDL